MKLLVPLSQSNSRGALLLGLALVGLLLGLALLSRSAAPATANPLTGVTSVSAGEAHTCVVTTSGGVKCWGLNNRGQLGNGSMTASSIPVSVTGLESGVAAVSAASMHTCALTEAGAVKCWGDNRFGQLGDGTETSTTAPVDAVGLSSGVTDIAAGTAHTCAVVSAAVQCWGIAYGGLTPATVPGLESDMADVAAGRDFNCALTTAGGVKCWGTNDYGQLGIGSTAGSGPADVVGLSSGITSIAAEGSAVTQHACALSTGGAVQCWGRNSFGQVGAPTSEICDLSQPCSTVPLPVTGLGAGIGQVTASSYNSCAVTTAGGVKCWGSASGSTPVDIAGLTSGISQVTKGSAHGCAVTDTGGVKCWGQNGHGQLGDATTAFRTTPVDVVELTVKPTPTETPCGEGGCPTSTPPPPCAVEACMGLAVRDGTGEVICHSEAVAVCEIAEGASFHLLVDAYDIPDQGYDLAQTFIDWGKFNPLASEDGAGPGTCDDGLDNGGDSTKDRRDEDCVTVALIYNKATVPRDEFLWPDVELALSAPFGPGLVHHGAVTSILFPQPESFYVGFILELEFSCPMGASSTMIQQRVQGDPITLTSGAMYEHDGLDIVPPPSSLIVNCIEAYPEPGDSDADICQDVTEVDVDVSLGGQRNFFNPWDFYDVLGGGGGPRDGVVDLPNDILGVIQHYSPDGGAPYEVIFDRGPAAFAEPWSMTAPDGVIDLPNDILGVIQQFNHRCQQE